MVKLPRLPPSFEVIPNKDQLLQRYWQQAMEAIETTLNAILAIPEIQDALAAAQASADAAADSAAAAQAAADAAGADNGITNSYVTGLTLEAFNDGANCHVDISDHMRVYGDGTEVSVTGGTISSLAFDTVVRVFYDQADRAGGAVTYQWSSDSAEAAQGGDRHSVGAVVTPRSAEMDSVKGGGSQPPGFVIP